MVQKLPPSEKKRRAKERAQLRLKARREKETMAVARSYANLAHELNRHVTLSDLMTIGITREKVRQYFTNMSNLAAFARKSFPKMFHDTDVATLIYDKKYFERFDKAITNKKRFVLTTAVTGCAAHKGFMSAIEHYCKINNAQPLVLVSSDPASNREFGRDYGTIDAMLMRTPWLVVIKNVALNSNIFLSTIKLSAKQINPTTGLLRIGQKNGSFVYASPKQSLKTIPVSNTKLPRVAMTTGAITKPQYTTENYMSQRTAYIADNDHVMGAVIIEVQDDVIYHYRQIQADEDGAFIDLGIAYLPDGTTGPVGEATLVMGDWHSGETDPTVIKATKEIIEQVNINRVVVHDLLSNTAINPHERGRVIGRAIKAKKSKNDLRSELEIVCKDLKMMLSWVNEVVVVKSNHDDFLNRWLQDGEFINDPINLGIGLELALALYKGKDPVKYGVTMNDEGAFSNVRWLKRDEDFKFGGIHLGAHGDRGSNGTKGGIADMENTYGQCVSAHRHAPEILRGAWQVGTSTFLKLGYNIGGSSWMQTHCIVYENGSRQLINMFDGKWRL